MHSPTAQSTLFAVGRLKNNPTIPQGRPATASAPERRPTTDILDIVGLQSNVATELEELSHAPLRLLSFGMVLY